MNGDGLNAQWTTIEGQDSLSRRKISAAVEEMAHENSTSATSAACAQFLKRLTYAFMKMFALPLFHYGHNLEQH